MNRKVYGVATLLHDGSTWFPKVVYTDEGRAKQELAEMEKTVLPEHRAKCIRENYICQFDLNTTPLRSIT